MALAALQRRLDLRPVFRTVCEANVYQFLSAALFPALIPLCRNLGMYKDWDNQHLITANIQLLSVEISNCPLLCGFHSFTLEINAVIVTY